MKWIKGNGRKGKEVNEIKAFFGFSFFCNFNTLSITASKKN